MKLIACSDSNLDNFTHLKTVCFSQSPTNKYFVNSLVKLTVVNGDGGLSLGFLPGLALAVHGDLVVDASGNGGGTVVTIYGNGDLVVDATGNGNLVVVATGTRYPVCNM